MIERLLPTLSSWIHGTNRPHIRSWWRRGPTWYLSTWWPSDSLATKQHALLRILAVAHSERLELAPIVKHFSEEHRGRYRRVLRRLAKRLASGTKLDAALEQTPDVLSDNVVLALRFGNQTGTLSSTYGQLLQSEVPRLDEAPLRSRHALVYWVVLSLTIAAIVTFLMSFIAPTFKSLHREFGMEMPGSFKLLIGTVVFISRYALLLLAATFAIAWLYWSSISRRFFRRLLATQFVRQVAQLRSVELLRLLALAAEAGRPLPGALSTLARYHFDRTVRQKLLFARNEVEQGEDIWKCLSDAKLLTVQESHALSLSPSNQLRAWTLQRMATGRQQALRRKAAAGFAILQPTVVLIFAAIVLWICFAFFNVLPHLINALA